MPSKTYGLNSSIKELFPPHEGDWDALGHMPNNNEIETLRKIKESGYLRVSYDKYAYLNYYFSGVDRKNMRPSWGYVLAPSLKVFMLIFDTKVLQDLPFRVCPNIWGGGPCLPEQDIESKKGKLKQKPSMEKTKEYINSKLEEGYTYFETNQVMVSKNISLDYLKAVICFNVTKEEFEEIQDIFPEVPVVPLKFTKRDYNKNFYFNKFVPIISN